MGARFPGVTERELFSIVRGPADSSGLSGVAVFVPPFVEEMNKCRRMMSLQCQRLADAGWQSWVFDLYGTGDSPGEFEEATLDTWIEDTTRVLEHVCEQQADRPVTVIGARFGALLAMAALARADFDVDSVVLWQPVLHGKEEVRQLERLHKVSGALSESATASSRPLAEQIEERETIDLAGYRLSSRLLAAMGFFDLLEQIPANAPPVHWIEVVAAGGSAIPPRRDRVAKTLADRVAGVNVEMVEGAKFWATTEISTAERVLQSTQKIITGGVS